MGETLADGRCVIVKIALEETRDDVEDYAVSKEGGGG